MNDLLKINSVLICCLFFISACGASRYERYEAQLVKQFESEKQDFDEATKSNTIDTYSNFIKKYPQSKLVKIARERINSINIDGIKNVFRDKKKRNIYLLVNYLQQPIKINTRSNICFSSTPQSVKLQQIIKGHAARCEVWTVLSKTQELDELYFNRQTYNSEAEFNIIEEKVRQVDIWYQSYMTNLNDRAKEYVKENLITLGYEIVPKQSASVSIELRIKNKEEKGAVEDELGRVVVYKYRFMELFITDNTNGESYTIESDPWEFPEIMRVGLDVLSVKTEKDAINDTGVEYSHLKSNSNKIIERIWGVNDRLKEPPGGRRGSAIDTRQVIKSN